MRGWPGYAMAYPKPAHLGPPRVGLRGAAVPLGPGLPTHVGAVHGLRRLRLTVPNSLSSALPLPLTHSAHMDAISIPNSLSFQWRRPYPVVRSQPARHSFVPVP